MEEWIAKMDANMNEHTRSAFTTTIRILAGMETRDTCARIRVRKRISKLVERYSKIESQIENRLRAKRVVAKLRERAEQREVRRQADILNEKQVVAKIRNLAKQREVRRQASRDIAIGFGALLLAERQAREEQREAQQQVPPLTELDEREVRRQASRDIAIDFDALLLAERQARGEQREVQQQVPPPTELDELTCGVWWCKRPICCRREKCKLCHPSRLARQAAHEFANERVLVSPTVPPTVAKPRSLRALVPDERKERWKQVSQQVVRDFAYQEQENNEKLGSNR